MKEYDAKTKCELKAEIKYLKEKSGTQLTKREQVAAMVLQGMMANSQDFAIDYDEHAEQAMLYADALIKRF